MSGSLPRSTVTRARWPEGAWCCSFYWSMIYSENRCPLFRIMLVVDQHPADGGEADDDSNRDRPYADPDVADDLPFGFVLGDLAIPGFVLLVRVTHRLVPA